MYIELINPFNIFKCVYNVFTVLIVYRINDAFRHI